MTAMSADAVARGEEFFEHYGRKGMKWYQNIFTSGSTGASRKAGKKPTSRTPAEDFIKARSSLSKHPSELSNADMDQLIRRLNLERSYSQLVNPPGRQTRGQKAAKFVTDLLLDVGKTEVRKVSKTGGALMVENALQKKKMSGGEFAKTVGERLAPKIKEAKN